ncbi:LysR family transcriptional regulator [Mesorhizobium sp. M0320]|uniref:helix-turn-helix domain-containing protein n=1 Tax=Mesorhizobium sp. M0320 TaxID=2956936 RepID=UPI00333C34B2
MHQGSNPPAGPDAGWDYDSPVADPLRCSPPSGSLNRVHRGVALKLRQPKVFREVLWEGSTRRAAAALGTSKPAVSQHVKQLETTLASHSSRDQPTASFPCRKPWNSWETYNLL